MARQGQRTAAAQASGLREDKAPARTAQPVPLKRHGDRRTAARAAIAEGCAQLLHNVTAFGSGFDPELVHQARVGLRRLRVFVRLFRKQLGPARARSLTGELRWLFVVLGRLRDLQVFRETRLPKLSGQARALATLRATLRRHTVAAERAVSAALRGERFDSLCHELAAIQQQLKSPARAGRRTRRWLARRLEHQHRRALRHARPRQEATSLHELRKELKSLRYTAELAAALYPRRNKRVRSYLRALREVQDVLGAWVDQQVARDLLSQLAAPPLRQRLATQLAREELARLAELAVSLPAFAQAEPFWR